MKVVLALQWLASPLSSLNWNIVKVEEQNTNERNTNRQNTNDLLVICPNLFVVIWFLVWLDLFCYSVRNISGQWLLAPKVLLEDL